MIELRKIRTPVDDAWEIYVPGARVYARVGDMDGRR
jgi:hypothetical protein